MVKYHGQLLNAFTSTVNTERKFFEIGFPECPPLLRLIERISLPMRICLPVLRVDLDDFHLFIDSNTKLVITPSL